ncbi:MAG: hypothetical protein JST33_04420 [Actinobacteria bacterium]|nr:hypothetical protein [Actinomycetota bacterium]
MTSFRLPPVVATTPWSAGINLAGALAVGYGLWHAAPTTAPWVLWSVIAGLAAWVARTLIALRSGSRTVAAGEGSAAGGSSVAGFSVAGSSVAGSSVAGSSVAGSSVAGSSVAGSSVAGSSAADSSVAGSSVAGFSSGGLAARATAAALLVVMVLAGAVTAIPTQGLGVALLIVAVLVMTSDPAIALPVWGGAVLVGVLGIAAGAVLAISGAAGPDRVNVLGLIAVFAGLALAVVAGLGRRAQRVLLAERERARADALRAEATAHRVAIARDLHDVLAHSLGGLVVQLDAAEALLDAGNADRAAERVTAARRLAVAGLDEAREAVRALREPAEERGSDSGAAVAPAEFERRVRELVAEAGETRLDVAGAPRPLSAALAEALARAVQEGMSNARKHAPGTEVRIRLVWHPDRVECTIENPIRPGAALPRGDRGALAATGGGYGLAGIRERFAVLGGTVQAGVMPGPSAGAGIGGGAPRRGAAEAGDRFVLRVEAPA